MDHVEIEPLADLGAIRKPTQTEDDDFVNQRSESIGNIEFDSPKNIRKESVPETEANSIHYMDLREGGENQMLSKNEAKVSLSNPNQGPRRSQQ